MPVSRCMGAVSARCSRTCNKGWKDQGPKCHPMRRRGLAVLSLLTIAATLLVVVPGAPSEALPIMAPTGTYQNPVFAHDFPDPNVIDDHGTYVASATNANGPNIQLVTSTDLRTWVLHRDALPSLPAWAVPGRTWAPTIARVGKGFVLYYTARHRTGGISC